jgi:hypothetical protein
MPVVYGCDEFRMQNDDWYKDLEHLLKSNIVSEVVRRSDIMTSLAHVKQQIKLVKFEQSNHKSTKKKVPTYDHVYYHQLSKQIEAHPDEKAELYNIFL